MAQQLWRADGSTATSQSMSRARSTRRLSAAALGAAGLATHLAAGAGAGGAGSSAASRLPAAFAGSELLKPERDSPNSEPPKVTKAWSAAAKRIAQSRRDAPAYVEAAWYGTEAWWLRPAAYALAVSAGVTARLWTEPPKAASVSDAQAAEVSEERLSIKHVAAAKGSLRRIELPFFATRAELQVRPESGIVMGGNFRAGALENLPNTVAVLEATISEELGFPVAVKLLRAEVEGPVASASTDLSYEVFVMVPKVQTLDETSIAISLLSLAVCLACAAFLGSSDMSQAAGAILMPGSGLPLAPLGGLLAVGQLARFLAARNLGAIWKPPVFLPSPQCGVLGGLSPETAAPSRTSALAVALSGPLAMFAASAALIAFGTMVGSGNFIDLHSPLNAAWPLALLPTHCDALVWAGVQGFWMGSMALLPHSPDGRVAVQSLLGRGAAFKIAEVFSYAYPVLSLLSAYQNGAFWSFMPFWWAWLMINFASNDPPSPKEEVTEVPIGASVVAYMSLIFAFLFVYPWPLHTLGSL